MALFHVKFNNGSSAHVNAPDKYEAIEKAKQQTRNTTGIKEVKDSSGRVVG